MNKFANAIAAAAAATPMLVGNDPVIPGRVLLVDGDALCYTCAGNAETLPAQARINMMERIRRAKAAAQAESVRVLVTARGSHKGHRYAIAAAKPYQGQRTSGRRPENWEYLRQLIEGGVPNIPTEVTAIAEADDLFAKYGLELGYENVVHHTQDKDMRMVPGWHLTWDDFYKVFVPAGTWELWFNEKLYGRKWFWLQMLHGDTADNVPGLPKMTKPDGKQALCGPATAEKLLADCANEAEARAAVLGQYRCYYGDVAPEMVLEQGILLWMRQRPGDVFDVCAPGNPLEGYDAGRSTILQRIAEVQACQPS